MADKPSARDWIKGTLMSPDSKVTGPIIFLPLLRALEGGQHYLGGRIFRRNTRFIGVESTEPVFESDLGREFDPILDKLQERTANLCVDLNRKILRELDAEFEYQRSDEAVAEALDSNEFYFDDNGDQVDVSKFRMLDDMPPALAQKILADYSEMFNRTPDEVFQALMKRKAKFDHRGNWVNTTYLTKVNELPLDIKKLVLDKFRDWNTEDDRWAESVQDAWHERLEKMGFQRVELAWSVGGGDDGASFTADAIDGLKLVKHLLNRQDIEKQVESLVGTLLP